MHCICAYLFVTVGIHQVDPLWRGRVNEELKGSVKFTEAEPKGFIELIMQ